MNILHLQEITDRLAHLEMMIAVMLGLAMLSMIAAAVYLTALHFWKQR
jgi:hypothetical protein